VPSRRRLATAISGPEARITLGVEDIPALCAATGATRFVPHGQFQFARGEFACSSELNDRLQLAMAAYRPETQTCALKIGQGVSLDAQMAGMPGALA
jgi:hypothetical protein